MRSFIVPAVGWVVLAAYLSLLAGLARWLTAEPRGGRIRAWSRAAAAAATGGLAAACAACWWAFVTYRHGDTSRVAPVALLALFVFADALVFLRAARAESWPGVLRFPRRALRGDGPASGRRAG